MIKLACSTILLVLLSVSCIPAEPASIEFLSAEQLEQLSNEGELQHSLWKSSPPELIPAVTMKSTIEQRIAELDLSVGMEVLCIYRREGIDFETQEAKLKIYNILRSISSMQGIEYYSASRKKMRTLFARSYVIDDPETRDPLPDPLVEEIPAYSLLYVLQEDLTFGENLYRSEYYYTDDYFLLENRNLTTMRYFMLPMVKPGQSATFILLVPEADQVVFYGAIGAHTISLFGLERKKQDSFYNRLKATYGWFTDRIELFF
jgi:hypothetical protein